MSLQPHRRFPRRILILVVVLALVAVTSWRLINAPLPPPFSEGEALALKHTARQVVAELRPQLPGSPVRIGLVPIQKDPHQQLSDALRAEIDAVDGWTLEDSTRFRQWIAEISHTLAEWTSFDRLARTTDPDKADLLIAGKVLSVSGDENQASARVEFHAYDQRQGKWLVRREYSGEWRASWLDRAQRTLATIPRPFVWAGWLVVVGVLPWLTTPLTRMAVRRRSNLASFALVAGHTALALLLAGLLLRFQLRGFFDWATFLVLFLGCATYAWWACERQAGDIIESGQDRRPPASPAPV